MNTFGRALRVSTWGSSHGAGIGVLIDGLPAGLAVDMALLRKRLAARQGGGLGTPRKEPDEPEILAGIDWCASASAGEGDGGSHLGRDGDGSGAGEGAQVVGYTTGDPIALFVRNLNTRSGDYDDLIRPAHADGSWRAKWGRPLGAGGGRASARESVAKVIAGAFAAMLLREFGLRVHAALIGVGRAELTGQRWSEADFAAAEQAAAERGLCALGGADFAAAAVGEIEAARKSGDSVGASVAVGIFGAPAGLGEVLYDRLDARLAQALMGLNAVKAVQIGLGAEAARMRGSEANDEFIAPDDAMVPDEKLAYIKGNARANSQNFVSEQENYVEFKNLLPNETNFAQITYPTRNNYSGGVLGGLSTGEDIQLRVHFKPTPTIAREQLIALPDGRLERRCLRGRHDPCVGVRGAVVARSLAELVLADFLLLGAASRLENLRKIYKN